MRTHTGYCKQYIKTMCEDGHVTREQIQESDSWLDSFWVGYENQDIKTVEMLKAKMEKVLRETGFDKIAFGLIKET